MRPGRTIPKPGVLTLLFLLLLTAAPSLLLAANEIVSVNSSGTASGSGYSTVDDQWCWWWCEPLEYRIRISNDGNVVAFGSDAADLAAPDFNSNRDIFARNLVTGVTELVSVNAAGTAGGNNNSFDPAVNGDGRFVAFASYSSDLVSGIGWYGYPNVFLRDLQTDTTLLVSVSADGTTSGSYPSQQPDVTTDGSSVVFVSGATNLVATSYCGNYPQVYARNMITGVTTLVSQNTSGAAGCYEALHPAVSDDGRYVAFMSYGGGQLVPGASANRNIYVRDLQTGTTALVNDTVTGDLQPNCESYYPSISADGRFVAFQSCASNLTPNDTNGNWDIFVRDLQNNTTELISVDAAGTAPANSSCQIPIISADGDSVVFRSGATNLVNPPMGGGNQLFVRRRSNATTKLVSISDDGLSPGNLESYYANISGDGRFISFASRASNLVSVTDANSSWWDVFVRDTDLDATKLVSIRATSDYSGSGESYAPFLSRDASRVVFMSWAPDLVALIDTNGTWDVFVDSPQFLRGSPQLMSTTYEVQEGITTAAIQIERAGGRDGQLSVDVTTSDGTANAGEDYTPTATTVTFHNGEFLPKTVLIPISDDVVSEGDQTFTVTLSNPQPPDAVLGSPIEATVTIVDNDQLPTLYVNDVTLNEGNTGTTTAAFTVRLPAASGQTVMVDYSTADLTATAGSDYVAASGTLTFNAGETEKAIVVTVNGDAAIEPTETFEVLLSGASNAIIGDGQGNGTIVDDDGATANVGVLIGDVYVTEGNSGTTSASFNVTLTSPSTGTVTVDFATASSTATQGSDFVAASGTVTFLANETSKTVSIDINGDTTVESDEVFFLNLTNPSGASLFDTQGLGTITNDDVAPPMPRISVSDATVAEGNSASADATFTVTLSAASPQNVTVDFQTSGVTATEGTDYVGAAGTLTINAGDTTGTISVSVMGDTEVESNEVFFLNLSNAGNGILSDNQGVGVINNDDEAPMRPGVSIADVSVNEGDSGTTSATFTVSLSAATSNPVSVDYASAGMTATAGADFNAAFGTVNFAAGETSKTITIDVIGDTTIEPNELFAVTLSTATNATITDNQAIGTIVNDDSTVTLSIGDTTVKEGNTGHTTASFVVSLSAPSQQSVSVDYATGDGNATGVNLVSHLTGETDYQIASGTLVIPAGATSATISIQVLGDTTDEATETFEVNLSNPTNAVLADATGIGTILDNDPLPTVSASDISVMEGNSGTVTVLVPVVVTPASGRDVTVSFTTVEESASSTTDYFTTSGSLTIDAGTGIGFVPVSIRPNSVVEGNETFLVRISAPTFATMGDDEARVTIANDDGAAVIVGPTVLATLEQGSAVSFNVVLNSEPTSDVVIPVSSSDTTEGTVAVSQLTFTPADWSTPQSVTVTPADDSDEDGDAIYSIILAAASAGDGNYNDLDAADVTITNADDEFAPVIVSLNPDNVVAAGGTITILGADFQDGATVMIGNVAATDVTFVDASTLTATVPPLGAGTIHDVAVTNPDGLSGSLPRGLVIDFVDVPLSHGFHDWVENLFRRGITAGCGGGNFCMNNSVTQAQMSVFLLSAKHGIGFVPPSATGTVFNDVPVGSFAAAWIEQLFREGITLGCGNGSFCPTAAVTRADMAFMLLRAKHGRNYVPPPATGIFNDVLASEPRAPWIEQLFNEGITAGCGGGNFCPDSPNTRGQMAVFILTTFD